MSIKNFAVFLSLFCNPCYLLFAQHNINEAVPVMIGGSATLDACSGLAQVSGLKPITNNFLSVRIAPNVQATEIDRVSNGQLVYTCDESQDKEWVGIVYASPKLKQNGKALEDSNNCGVSSPIANKNPYQGPCSTGWVSVKYIKPLAG